jgi:hypothetical protein
MTEWNQYRALDLEQLKKRVKDPVFIDLRNVYDPETMRSAGFRIHRGRQKIVSAHPETVISLALCCPGECNSEYYKYACGYIRQRASIQNKKSRFWMDTALDR